MVIGLSSESSDKQSGHTSGRLFFWIPVFLGVVATIPLFSISGWGSTTMIGAISVFLTSIFFGCLLHRRHIHAIEHLLHGQEKLRLSDASFYGQIFPVWSRQIGTFRNTGDKAVAELTTLFGKIVNRLETMLKMSSNNASTGQSCENSFLGAIESSQTTFKSVFKDLKEALVTVNDSKAMLLAEVTNYSEKMKDMAADGQQVAMQSRIIALNAQIEAARAGEAGRAFAAVACEMRQLSNQSADASVKLAKNVESIDAAMARFYEEEEQVKNSETMHVSRAETMFGEIIERFNKVAVEMEKSITVMESESRQVRDDISSSLVALQFQDRVSQIMAHVADNINALNDLAEADVRNFDADVWLSEMEDEFTVEEEHSSLREHQTTSTHSSLLTYF